VRVAGPPTNGIVARFAFVRASITTSASPDSSDTETFCSAGAYAMPSGKQMPPTCAVTVTARERSSTTATLRRPAADTYTA
jgi:hypothetical protein